ncbi:MAG TPA: antitoxin MazE-like protein [Acidobacteriaceae bacterium]|nr:antitoxin MazE-like protein [Acidobacteriaceae bacterium]
MRDQSHNSDSLNFRVEPQLKADFVAAAEKERKPVADVLRELMRGYVRDRKRKAFVVEARRQSRLIAGSREEKDAGDWADRAADTEGWK